MVHLKKNQMVLLKLNQDEIFDLVKEQLFSCFNDYGNISNNDIVSTVYFMKEKNDSYSVIACYQPTILKTKEQNLINEDSLNEIEKKHDLTKEPKVFTVDEIKKILYI